MKSQINTLRQLQELVLTRDEHHQTGDGSRLDTLNDIIAELGGKLDPQVRGLYDRLYKKSHIVISAMTNGCCAVCGMQVPIAQAQQVRLAQHLVTCSNCGRILFATAADEPANIAEKGERDDVKTGISRFSAEELVISGLKAATREEAIAELALRMEQNKFISNAEAMVSAAIQRENVLSTALGGGIAFPHVRGVEGGALTMAMGVSHKGIDWDGEKVHIVFLSAIPVAVSAFYLRLMSGIMQAYDKKENYDAALAAKNAGALWRSLVKATHRTIR
ncbi:MAG TPA: hypothetical protein DD637_01695 [Verrucomicrobia bacterium]|nr:hypothetical protein [Verrucomicrobiota bacterium]